MLENERKNPLFAQKRKIVFLNDFNEDSFEIFDFFKNKIKKGMKFIY